MEPAPKSVPPVDLRIGATFPSTFEIAGLVAAVVPFVITYSSGSSETVNGEVVSFVYRDWVAIVCGVAAAACGAISILQLGRTDAAKRMLRIGAIVLLLGLGVFQILRGIGKIGVDHTDASSHTDITITRTPEPPPNVPAVDVDGPSRKMFELWGENKIKEVYDVTHPNLKKKVTLRQVQHLHDLFEHGFGKLQKVEKLKTSYEDPTFTVKGDAIHEKGTLPFTLEYQLVDGKPLLITINFKIPTALEVEPVAADADKVARQFLDSLLAGKLQTDVLDPALLDNVTDDFAPKLKAVLVDIGKIKSITAPKARDCSTRCLMFELKGAKKPAVFEVELTHSVRRWVITKFDLTAAGDNKKKN